MKLSITHILIIAYFAASLVAFVCYGIDKLKAKHDWWRISEKTLLTLAVFAPFGCRAGMRIFHHKTQKTKFNVVTVAMCIVHILLFCAAVYLAKNPV